MTRRAETCSRTLSCRFTLRTNSNFLRLFLPGALKGMATSRDNSSPDHERSIHSPSPLREGRPNPRLSSPAPGPSAGPYGSGSQQRSVAEVVQEQFEPFDHRTTIVDPFEEENKREAEFRESKRRGLQGFNAYTAIYAYIPLPFRETLT